ncbi:MAG: metalloregulator ArsR/SmtB family transcription factor [Candidatus Omnitrophica bacterium]|nr:metalloregulator ArsR/SmtB family transcription factor [Candidatus Omnitrophota bacterium]
MINKSGSKLLANYLQALAHPLRVEILEILKDKNRLCVCELVRILKRDQSIISRHLNTLRQAGILDYKEEGTRSLHSVKNKEIYKILDKVKTILRKEIKQHKELLKAI